MSVDAAINFFKEYLEKTDPMYEKYLKEKKKEASEICDFEADAVERFLEMSRKGKKLRGALVVLVSSHKIIVGNLPCNSSNSTNPSVILKVFIDVPI